MITRSLLAALSAGLIAGVLITPVQYARVVPLILHAETFENGTAAHEHAEGPNVFVSPATAAPSEAAAPVRLAHAQEAGTPGDNAGEEEANASLFASRILGTILANLVTGAGFALLLCAASLILGVPITAKNGVAWGLAGFAVVALAPAMGLPPELPAMPAADLAARQAWWLATVVLSAAGVAALALRREPLAKAAGLFALALPHLVGAPQPAELASPVPPTLAAEFAVASLATGAVFWVLIGVLSGHAFDRAARGLTLGRPAVSA